MFASDKKVIGKIRNAGLLAGPMAQVPTGCAIGAAAAINSAS
jgi:hypothetical protein